jgi:acyl-CoA thioesterase
MQGGLIVAMADETIAHAIMTLLGSREEIATVELKNNFIAPAKEGTLTAEATIFKKGRSLVVGDCIVTRDDGVIVSRSSATFLICQE